MKKAVIIPLATLISLNMSVSSFAGSWKQDTIGWTYINDDGSSLKNQWAWIDGNNDGIAESYYFDERGYMATNRDVGGYWVNADGAWVDMYGTVQTKVVNNNMPIAPIAQGNGSTTGNTVVNNNYNSSNSVSNIYDAMDDSTLISNFTYPNGEPNFEALEAWDRREEAKKNAMFDGQSHENWKDYLGYSVVPEWVYDKYVEQGAHVYWNGSEIAVDWPNGIKPGSEADTERKFWEDYNSTTLEEKREYILEQINKYRKKKGAEPLEFNDELNDYAQMRAEELEEHFGHARPNGEYFSNELELEYHTYGFGECGANVGSYKNAASGWYNSPKHKKIMTDKKAKICGIGVNGRYIDLITYDGYL